jgi:biofilm PGA synthesis N-glycosyltransferase PgaC
MPPEGEFAQPLPATGLSAPVPTIEAEYDRLSGEVPVEVLTPLFVVMLAFGLFLTIVVPSAFAAKALAEATRDSQVLFALWNMALCGLSFFVLLRWCAIQTMAFVARCKLERDQPDPPAFWPLVSVLVPAYQEGETIASALRSLIELDYPQYEIIVVDDGSPDDTFAKAKAFVGDHGRCSLHLLHKPNGGKWSALNLAFERARGDLVLCIDADSRLRRDALKRLVAHMDSPEVAGVAGQITVRNRRNVVTRLQAYEYIVANGGLRTAQSLCGLVLVVPGPIGLYRRAALQQVFERDGQSARPLHAGEVPGPFSHETFAEDFQLSLTVLAFGGRIVYEPRAISYTKSPDLLHLLLNQRYRWFRGTMQVLRIYNRRLRYFPEAKRQSLSLVIAGIYLFDLYLLPIINFVIVLILVTSAATSTTMSVLFLWVGAVWLLNLMAGTYHILTQGDDLSLLYLVPIYDLYHVMVLNSAWTIAAVDELRQSKMNW